MKFIMIVLAAHFTGEWISRKRKDGKRNADEKSREIVFHPAEFQLRYDPSAA